MRVLFYSKTCDFCMKLIEYINKNTLNEYFNMICIDDDTTKIPKNITVVPTIIDEEIEAPLEGKKAFEYVINQKYFNHPTNNTEFTKNGVPKPTIEEDKKACNSKSGSGFIFVSEESGEKDERSNFDKVFSLNKDLQLESQQKSQPQSKQQYQSQPQQQTQPQQSLPAQPQANSSSQQKLLLTRQQFQQKLQPVAPIKPQPVQQATPTPPAPQPPQPPQASQSKTMDALMRLRGRR